MDARTRAAASIEQAKADLDRALAAIDSIQTFDPSAVGLVAHALSNYSTVTAATVEMLQLALRDHPNPDIAIWLEGLHHAADLAQHSVGRLAAVAPPSEFPLKLDYVNLPILMERSCEFHRRHAGATQVEIRCREVGRIPLVRGDRVSLAMIAEDLISNAVDRSRPGGTVHVQIMAEPGFVVCSVRDEGSGLSREQQEELFRRPFLAGSRPSAERGAERGLAVAREFVCRMKGDIWCESGPGNGACFSFRLPADE